MKIRYKVLLLTLLGALAGVVIGYQQLALLTSEQANDLIRQLGSREALIALAAAQTMVLTAISATVGYLLRRKLDLPDSKWPDRTGIFLAVAIGTASSILMILAEKLIFLRFLPAGMNTFQFSPLYLFAALLYGGIIEEVLLRLGLMTVVLWLITAAFGRRRTGGSAIQVKRPIGEKEAWTAILISALAFAAGHLPATAQLLGLSTPIVLRAIILNGIPGIGFGWLYWKKGLVYAILGHMITHLVSQLVMLPLLF
jgi:hypothetical protein